MADTKLIYEKHGVRLLSVTTRSGIEVFDVLGNGPTKVYEDYDDALEEYNLRWMKIEYGE